MPSSHQEGASWAELTPRAEIREFLTTARAHFAALFPVTTLLAIHDDPDAIDPYVHWSTLVDHGYTAIGLPESLGGLGEFASGIMLLEESGYALLPVPLTASIAAAHTAVTAGIADDSAASTPMSIALAPSEARDRDTAAVFDGRLIHEVVVITESESGMTVDRREVVERTVESEPIDPSRATATVRLGRHLGSARIPSSQRDHLLAPARLCLAADLLGVASLSLDLAVSHALAREQFGQPIGAFQSVKHLLADVYVAQERARSLLRGAAAEHSGSQSTGQATQLSLLAKASAAEVAVRSTALRTQLLGAMGLTFESDNHLAVRRANQTAPFLGTARELYVRAARNARREGGANV